MKATIEQWADYIKSETLADELREGEPPARRMKMRLMG